MAKSFAMGAKAAGVDITDQAQLNAFMLEYNHRILSQRVMADDPDRLAGPDAPQPQRIGYTPQLSAAERAAQRKAQRVRDKNVRRKSRR
jgi:hypothetical protein